MNNEVQFRLRVRRGDTIAVGPGKIALLEAIAQTGSISAAARALDMSYRRAWLLIDETNRSMTKPAVGTAAGGTHGGGSVLTEEGLEVVRLYREIERKAAKATARELAALESLLVKTR
jgi:molybdate transport system regulatory protein